MQSLRRTIFNAPRSSLLATSRLPCSASSPTATTIRHYGGTGAQHKGESHGGQPPTESNTGETGQTGPSADAVAQADSAFDSNPDPKSASKGVEKELPSDSTMKQSAANPDSSRQFDKSSEAVPDTQHTKKNTSNDASGNKRSGRGPGKDV